MSLHHVGAWGLSLLVGVPLVTGLWGREPHRPAPAVAAAGTGRIVGQVHVGQPLKARKPRFRPYTDYGPEAGTGPTTVAGSEPHVVIYLDSVPSPEAPSSTVSAVMVQRNEQFVPHVLPVQRGTTVEFPNQDPFFHNVFSLSGTRSFDLGRYPRGHAKSIRFDTPGVVQVFCHIHSDMTAYVVVLENRFFTTPTKEGRFRLDGVPAGRHRLVAWHERANPVTRMIVVPDGGTAEVELVIPIPPEADR